MKEIDNINLLSTKVPKCNYPFVKTRNENVDIKEMMASQHLLSTKKTKCTNVVR
jgi:hypothetical protein